MGAAAGTAVVGSTKVLLAGALFGSAVTVGLAAMLLFVRPAGSTRDAATTMGAPAGTATGAPAGGAGAAETSAQLPAATSAPMATDVVSADAPLAPSTKITSPATKRAATAAPRPLEDPLMHEASLLAEARGALVRGDAAGAMRALRAARQLPQRQLEPEALALGAQALRALGRGDEATSVDGKLKGSFPDHPLAR